MPQKRQTKNVFVIKKKSRAELSFPGNQVENNALTPFLLYHYPNKKKWPSHFFFIIAYKQQLFKRRKEIKIWQKKNNNNDEQNERALSFDMPIACCCCCCCVFNTLSKQILPQLFYILTITKQYFTREIEGRLICTKNKHEKQQIQAKTLFMIHFYDY